jgi:hypothetical protein
MRVSELFVAPAKRTSPTEARDQLLFVRIGDNEPAEHEEEVHGGRNVGGVNCPKVWPEVHVDDGYRGDASQPIQHIERNLFTGTLSHGLFPDLDTRIIDVAMSDNVVR